MAGIERIRRRSERKRAGGTPGGRATLGGRMGSSRGIVARRVEPRTSLRALGFAARTDDQPRDHLPAHLARSEKRSDFPPHLRGARKSAANAMGVMTVAAVWREKLDRRSTGHRRGRRQLGHWEIDTVMGKSPGESSHCVLTLVEHKTGYLIWQTASTHRGRHQPRMLALMRVIRDSCARSRRTTAPSSIGMARSKHSVRSTSTSPPRTTVGSAARTKTPTASSASTSPKDRPWPTNAEPVRCNRPTLNNRPRKRYGYKSPNECFLQT